MRKLIIFSLVIVASLVLGRSAYAAQLSSGIMPRRLKVYLNNNQQIIRAWQGDRWCLHVSDRFTGTLSARIIDPSKKVGLSEKWDYSKRGLVCRTIPLDRKPGVYKSRFKPAGISNYTWSNEISIIVMPGERDSR